MPVAISSDYELQGQKLSGFRNYPYGMEKMINTRYGMFPKKLKEEECRIRYREWLKDLALEEITAHLWNYRSTAASAGISPDQRFRFEALMEENRRREQLLFQRCA